MVILFQYTKRNYNFLRTMELFELYEISFLIFLKLFS